ncbi:MAG: FAD:protein FMN transferase [Bacteroidales bacterium]|nr:FAD:protein FMN transferase [Bacteroidales bacterium]
MSLRLHAIALILVLTSCTQHGYVQIGGYAQGGTWTVKYNTAGVKPLPAEVQRGVESILSDIDRTLSGYNKSSELSRLNAGDTIVPSPMLIGLYNRSRQIWEATGGAVDVAAGPLFDIWGFGFKSGEFPDDAAVSAALAVSGMGRLLPRMEDGLLPDGRLCASRLVAEEGRQQNQPKMQHPPVKIEGGASKSPENAAALPQQTAAALPQLNFNAIAQGYSCDTVASYLASLGVRDMLVDIGEILCRGVNASGRPWRVGVDRPVDGNATPGADLDGLWESDGLPPFQGIVTSGNYRKFYVRDGVKYSHTIDPRTGRPAENGLLSATIVAPSAELADALATYCMVIGLDAARQYILMNPSIEGYLIYAPNPAVSSAPDEMSEWASPGFNLK